MRLFAMLVFSIIIGLISFALFAMNGQPPCDYSHLDGLMQESLATLEAVAWDHKEDTLALLSILRQLEKLHRHICEEIFQPSLPDTRNALYNLLRDIDESGGWPYIERMKLKALLSHCLEEPSKSSEPLPPTGDLSQD
jgi:hypothetical protein